MGIHPKGDARLVSEVQLGSLIVVEIGGSSFWCLKCGLSEDPDTSYGLPLGPLFPDGMDAPYLIEIGSYEKARALDFGAAYVLGVATDASKIFLAVPDTITPAWGIVMAGDQPFVRIGPGPGRLPAQYIELATGQTTPQLPSEPRVFIEGWTFSLPLPETATTLEAVAHYPPTSEQHAP